MAKWLVFDAITGVAPEDGGLCILSSHPTSAEDNDAGPSVSRLKDERISAGSSEVVSFSTAFDATAGCCAAFILVRTDLSKGSWRYLLFASDERSDSGFTNILTFQLRDNCEATGFLHQNAPKAMILDGPILLVPRTNSLVVASLAPSISRGELGFVWNMHEIPNDESESLRLVGACCLCGDLAAPIAFMSGVSAKGQRTSNCSFLTSPAPKHVTKPQLPARITASATQIVQIILGATEAPMTNPKTCSARNTAFAVSTETKEVVLLDALGNVLWVWTLLAIPQHVFVLDFVNGEGPHLLLHSQAAAHSLRILRPEEEVRELGKGLRGVAVGRLQGRLGEVA
eukprot:1713366-Rhodomonas_salina.1